MSNLRAMNRRLKKLQEKPTQKVDKVQKAREQGILTGYSSASEYSTAQTMRLCTTAFVAAAKEEYDLGGRRIRRLLEQYIETMGEFIRNPDHEEYLREWIKNKYNLDLDQITGVGPTLNTRRKLITPSLTDDEISTKMNESLENLGEMGDAVMAAYQAKTAKGRALN